MIVNKIYNIPTYNLRYSKNKNTNYNSHNSCDKINSLSNNFHITNDFYKPINFAGLYPSHKKGTVYKGEELYNIVKGSILGDFDAKVNKEFSGIGNPYLSHRLYDDGTLEDIIDSPNEKITQIYDNKTSTNVVYYERFDKIKGDKRIYAYTDDGNKLVNCILNNGICDVTTFKKNSIIPISKPEENYFRIDYRNGFALVNGSNGQLVYDAYSNKDDYRYVYNRDNGELTHIEKFKENNRSQIVLSSKNNIIIETIFHLKKPLAQFAYDGDSGKLIDASSYPGCDPKYANFNRHYSIFHTHSDSSENMGTTQNISEEKKTRLFLETYLNKISSRKYGDVTNDEKTKLSTLLGISIEQLDNLSYDKKLYRQLCKKFHPDMNQGNLNNELIMKILNVINNK